MPTPKLNTCKIKIKRLLRVATLKDVDFQEPISELKRSQEIEIEAQTNFNMREGGKFNILSPTITGDSGQSEIYLIALSEHLRDKTLWDMENPEFNLKKGDTIVEIEGVGRVDLRIHEVRPESWMRGRPALVYARLMLNPERTDSVM